MARLQGLALIFLAVTSALVGTALACGYATCPKSYDTSKLQLHIISHSHDDVGWLSTPDGYADQDVNPLLSHVVAALHKNPHRKFVEVEMYYFKRWWQRQTKVVHDIVHQLVKSGQLAFANGGWCINDEASPLYNNIIDQMTLGIQFLRDTFGECAEPKLSWQIDPFGASREQANLFAMMGFDGHVLNRGNGHLHGEFLWNASRSHSIFTSRLHAHYSAPNGFNFEDRDHITEQNKHEKAKALVELGKRWNHDYGSRGHVLIPFGDDFRYKNAEGWFSNLDKLIEVVNKEHPDVHLQYSSPHCYIKAMHEAIKKNPVPVKSEDYFPLWTGYYSSRPQVKYLDRYANNLLQAAKQLEVVADLHDTQSLLLEGKNELAVLQHHDAVSGTSRPFVMVDYRERLVNAIHSLSRVISEGLAKLTAKTPSDNNRDLSKGPFVYTTANISDYVRHLEGEGFVTVVYNPLAQPLASSWLRLPVSGDHHAYTVHDQTGAELKGVSAVAISEKVKKLVGHHAQITHELVFEAKNLPALGFTTFFVTKSNTKSTEENGKAVATNAAGDLLLKGHNFEAVVDHKSGQLKAISRAGKSHQVAQSWAYYPGKHSSAYEFCPSGGSVDLSGGSKLVHSAQFEGFAEVTVQVNEWIWQTMRVYADRDYVELDQTIGPVADGDHISKEVITRFTTDLKSKGVFYTDANGRQDIERHRSTAVHECGGQRNTIWYNYYPVATATAIRDADDGHQLTIVTDRSVGAASEADGQLEVMLHRRLLEHKGLDIDMNDLDVDGHGVVARGRLFLFLSEKATAADDLRRQNHASMMQPITAFSLMSNIADYRAHHTTEWSALKVAGGLPENVHLLTLENWGPVQNNEVLVRFENFYQPADVESKWSKGPAKVPLDAFATLHPESVEKTNLIVGGRSKHALGDVEIPTQEIATFVYKVKRTVEHNACSLKWEKLAAGKKVPAHALLGGHETSGTPLYVCRHKSVDLLPGKFSEGLHCRISYGGREMMFDDAEVEVLVAPAGAHSYRWVPRHGGDPVPEAAFHGGVRAADRVPIYIGRCHAHGVVVGKIDEYFYYPYGGAEHKGVGKDCINHEILTC